MENNAAKKDTVSQVLQELTALSQDMNEAVQQKDNAKIEKVHLKKTALIDKLNALIIAQKKQ
jgi:predicted translin family RNA/ssDNA-binding protein